MKIGPKFKIARRLGAPIFEKTQTNKFKANQEKKSKGRGRPRARSDYGMQLLEKQKARFSYGISEKQFGNYVKKVITKRSKTAPQERLFEALERRLDNVIYRIGLAKTRLAARQMVSHGHIMVNQRKVDVPSFQVSKGDSISIRIGSANKVLFRDLETIMADKTVPSWLSFDLTKRVAEVQGLPKFEIHQSPANLSAVLEFYKR